jgi:hypothetical protein
MCSALAKLRQNQVNRAVGDVQLACAPIKIASRATAGPCLTLSDAQRFVEREADHHLLVKLLINCSRANRKLRAARNHFVCAPPQTDERCILLILYRAIAFVFDKRTALVSLSESPEGTCFLLAPQ